MPPRFTCSGTVWSLETQDPVTTALRTDLSRRGRGGALSLTGFYPKLCLSECLGKCLGWAPQCLLSCPLTALSCPLTANSCLCFTPRKLSRRLKKVRTTTTSGARCASRSLLLGLVQAPGATGTLLRTLGGAAPQCLNNCYGNNSPGPLSGNRETLGNQGWNG